MSSSLASKPVETVKVALVASRFNEPVTEALVEGAVQSFKTRGVLQENIHIVRVPGAWEIIQALQHTLRTQTPDCIVCLGAIIRGETPHFDYLSQAVYGEVSRIASNARIPVTMGILTTDTADQARARSVRGGRNKGTEASEAAWAMLDVLAT